MVLFTFLITEVAQPFEINVGSNRSQNYNIRKENDKNDTGSR